MSRYKEICGCVHVHFPLCELEKSFSYLEKSGRFSGIDFLVINSHTPARNTERYGKLFGREGYYGKTLIIKAEETEDKEHRNHVLLIGGSRWHGNKENVSDVLSEIENSDCVSFVAHPEGFHKFFLYRKEYFWNQWKGIEFTGIEIWSMLFDWAKFTRIYNIPARYFMLPGNLEGPSMSILSRWDELSAERKVVGIAGLDIHYLPFLFRCLDVQRKFFYGNIFKVLRNHLFIEGDLDYNASSDKKKILRAFREGRLFFANDRLGDSTGFFFGSEDGAFTMGDTVAKGRQLVIRNPRKALTRLVFNGQTLWKKPVVSEGFSALPNGSYRVEVSLQGRPWIYSNHIFTH